MKDLDRLIDGITRYAKGAGNDALREKVPHLKTLRSELDAAGLPSTLPSNKLDLPLALRVKEEWGVRLDPDKQIVAPSVQELKTLLPDISPHARHQARAALLAMERAGFTVSDIRTRRSEELQRGAPLAKAGGIGQARAVWLKAALGPSEPISDKSERGRRNV